MKKWTAGKNILLVASCILRAPDVRPNEARPGIRTTANITTTRRDRCRERPLINRSPPARRRRRRIAGGLVDARQPVRPVYRPRNNKYVLRGGAVVGKFDLSRRRTLFELFRAVCFFCGNSKRRRWIAANTRCNRLWRLLDCSDNCTISPGATKGFILVSECKSSDSFWMRYCTSC